MDLFELPSRLIPAQSYRRERWRNQQGWTREILKVGPSAEWTLRLSIAEIEQDADFSAFPGVERELVLLQGNGVRLRFDEGRCVELLPPHQRVRFAGEATVRGELIDGPTHDFNLMWRRDAVQASLLHRPLVGSMLFFSEPGVAWAIHLLGGHARFGPESGLEAMAAGDTAWLGAGARRRHSLQGAGELLAIRIEPAAPAPAPAQ
ncbi:MAG TPA: HutD family protein [Stenotrophomonas sp.]|jgi:environmental stress-induced protein Ves